MRICIKATLSYLESRSSISIYPNPNTYIMAPALVETQPSQPAVTYSKSGVGEYKVSTVNSKEHTSKF